LQANSSLLLLLSLKSAKTFVGHDFLDPGGTEWPVSLLPIEDAGEEWRYEFESLFKKLLHLHWIGQRS
jgi:hypothetical protein